MDITYKALSQAEFECFESRHVKKRFLKKVQLRGFVNEPTICTSFNDDLMKVDYNLINWEQNKGAYLKNFNEKIMTSAKTCGAKLKGHYVKTSKICSLMEFQQLFRFILVGDFNTVTNHIFSK